MVAVSPLLAAIAAAIAFTRRRLFDSLPCSRRVEAASAALKASFGPCASAAGALPENNQTGGLLRRIVGAARSFVGAARVVPTLALSAARATVHHDAPRAVETNSERHARAVCFSYTRESERFETRVRASS